MSKVKVTHLVGLGHLADDLPGGGVDGREGFPADGVLPFIVDEQLQQDKGKSFFSSSSLQKFQESFKLALGDTQSVELGVVHY